MSRKTGVLAVLCLLGCGGGGKHKSDNFIAYQYSASIDRPDPLSPVKYVYKCDSKPSSREVDDLPYIGHFCGDSARDIGLHSEPIEDACTILQGRLIAPRKCRISIDLRQLATRKYALCQGEGTEAAMVVLTIEQLGEPSQSGLPSTNQGPGIKMSEALYAYKWDVIGEEKCRAHDVHDISSEMRYCFNKDGFGARNRLTMLHAQTWKYLSREPFREFTRIDIGCCRAQRDRAGR